MVTVQRHELEKVKLRQSQCRRADVVQDLHLEQVVNDGGEDVNVSQES